MHIQRLAGYDGEIPRRLIQAAADAFALSGYAGTRVRDIVRAADVSLASVNYYFGGKEGLYAATLKELAAQQRDGAPEAPAQWTSREATLHAAILGILRSYVDGSGDARLGRVLAHESMNPTPYFDLLVGEILRPEVDRLRAVLRQLAGDRLDADTLQRSALSILGQCLFYLFARGAVERLLPRADEGHRLEALALHITRFSLGGVEACAAA